MRYNIGRCGSVLVLAFSQQKGDQMADENKNTVLGVTENLEALLCYALGWVTGLVFLLIEQKNAFVRFHAFQSLVTFLGLFIISAVIGFVPVIGILVGLLLWPLGLVLWIVLMVKAYKGERYKLPVVGDFVEQQLGK
jgi:uncharacterized membrane protein